MRKLTDEQRDMIENNHDLIYGFLKKYNLGFEEWYFESAEGLCDAALTFDETKGKFSTYAFHCMSSRVFKKLDHEKRFYNGVKVSIDEPIECKDGGITIGDAIEDTDQCFDELEVMDLFRDIIKNFNNRDKEIISKVVFGNISCREIGRIYGMSGARVNQIVDSFRRIAKRKVGAAV